MEATKLMTVSTSLVTSNVETGSSIKYTFEDPEPDVSTATRRNPCCLDVWPQILSSVILLSTIIQVGINMAYSGVLIPQLANDPNIKEFTKEEASWIASLGVVSSPVGAFVVGPMMDYIGRKKINIISNIPIVVSWIMIYFTKQSLWPIYTARILTGLSTGLTAVGIVYTTEISHVQFRPMLLSLISVNVALGILIVTLLGVYIEWHMAAIFYGSLALISLITSFFIPESPYWLATFTNASTEKIKSQVEYLNRTKWLFDEEWTVIQRVMDERKNGGKEESASNGVGIIRCFCERTSYLPLLLLFVLFLLQQTSGTYVIIYYTVNIFKSISSDFGLGFDEYNATTTLGVLRFIMSLITVVLSKKVKRRTLLIISSSGMALSAIVTAIFLMFNNISTIHFESDNATSPLLIQSENATTFGENAINPDILIDSWWILISVLTFVCASALGQMVVPWTMISELLPTKVRGSGSGLVLTYCTVLLFIMIKTFPSIADFMTLPFVFVTYSVMSVLTVIFVYIYLPETLGKNFAEIAKYFEKS